MMRLLLIRHGMTRGNSLRRYIGRTDEPLCEEGISYIKSISAGHHELVYVTPLMRTRQTAKLLFPMAEIRVVDGLREMDFGDFENRSADEMENDTDYRAWVDGWCKDSCPNGESMAEFSERVCSAFEKLVSELKTTDSDEGVFVLHGGSIMAILAKYGRPCRDYYEYYLKNCGAYSCLVETAPEGEAVPFILTHIHFEEAL